MREIFTFSGKGNGTLELLKDHFKLSSKSMHETIDHMSHEMFVALQENGIEYKNLKSALIPHADKEEAGFFFNTSVMDSVCYGYDILDNILPLLDKRTNQSILLGDLISKDKDLITKIIKEDIISKEPFRISNPKDVFCIYINNLSKSKVNIINNELEKYEYYIGYIPLTYSSPVKSYLSTILSNACLKHKNTIIIGHEDDRSDIENVNLGAPAFENFGYKVSSIKERHFIHFLSYKIDSLILDYHNIDNYFSINSLTKNIIDVSKLDILLDEEKHDYLLKEKTGKLKKSGLYKLKIDDITLLIKKKIQLTYLYNFIYLSEHNVMKFNVIIEVKQINEIPIKLTIAMEYMPEKNSLRIITLY